MFETAKCNRVSMTLRTRARYLDKWEFSVVVPCVQKDFLRRFIGSLGNTTSVLENPLELKERVQETLISLKMLYAVWPRYFN